MQTAELFSLQTTKRLADEISSHVVIKLNAPVLIHCATSASALAMYVMECTTAPIIQTKITAPVCFTFYFVQVSLLFLNSTAHNSEKQNRKGGRTESNHIQNLSR